MERRPSIRRRWPGEHAVLAPRLVDLSPLLPIALPTAHPPVSAGVPSLERARALRARGPRHLSWGFVPLRRNPVERSVRQLAARAPSPFGRKGARRPFGSPPRRDAQSPALCAFGVSTPLALSLRARPGDGRRLPPVAAPMGFALQSLRRRGGTRPLDPSSPLAASMSVPCLHRYLRIATRSWPLPRRFPWQPNAAPSQPLMGRFRGLLPPAASRRRQGHDSRRSSQLSWVSSSPGPLPDTVGLCFHRPPPSRFVHLAVLSGTKWVWDEPEPCFCLPASGRGRLAPRSLDRAAS